MSKPFASVFQIGWPAGRDLGGEVLLFALNALTEHHADKARKLDRRADILRDTLDDLGHLGLVVDHEGLLQQDDFLIELAIRPSTIFSTISSGLPDAFAWSIST